MHLVIHRWPGLTCRSHGEDPRSIARPSCASGKIDLGMPILGGAACRGFRSLRTLCQSDDSSTTSYWSRRRTRFGLAGPERSAPILLNRRIGEPLISPDSQVPGLTRLDLLSGLGICCLVAASILWVVVWLPLKPYRPPKQQPADTGADGHGTAGARGPGDGLSGAALDSPEDATPVRLS